MALSLFKKSPPAAADRPGLTALREHLAVIADLNDRRTKLGERMNEINRSILKADAIAADITATRDAIDSALADADYNHLPEPPLAAERRKLADLETQLKTASVLARRGQTVLERLRADADDLLRQRAALQPQTDRYLFNAASEEAAVYRDRYFEARDNLRNAAHLVFSALTACDTISKARGLGEFYGSQFYAELHVPVPLHPAFVVAGLTPEAAQEIRRADINAVSTEAEALIQRLLTLEG